MRIFLSLIILLFLIAGCGKKSDPKYKANSNQIVIL